ncbi:MAG: TspO/MBR family protein [Pseudomonadota bacterium]
MSNATPLPGYSRNPMDRADRVGMLWSILTPLVLAIVANAAIFLTGWSQEDQAYDAVSFSPPGWVVGSIWLLIFPMWGYARWKAYQAGPEGRRESWWAAALIAWSLAYPIVVVFLDTTGSAWMNVASLALAAVTAWRLSTVSRTAAAWVLPSLAWLTFASILGFAAVSTDV